MLILYHTEPILQVENSYNDVSAEVVSCQRVSLFIDEYCVGFICYSPLAWRNKMMFSLEP